MNTTKTLMRVHSFLTLLVATLLAIVGRAHQEPCTLVTSAKTWEFREDLVGDWRCVTNTFGAADMDYAAVTRLRVYRPYCHLFDIGWTNGLLEIAGAMMGDATGELRILGQTYYLHVTLPDRLFVGPIDGGVSFRLQRYRAANGTERLLLTKVRDPDQRLEFELVKRECPPPADADVPYIFRTTLRIDLDEMDRTYRQLKEEVRRKLVEEVSTNRAPG